MRCLKREIKSKNRLNPLNLNIAEGYGRRRYKQEFIRRIIYALASNDETIDHLDILFVTESLKDKSIFDKINNKLVILGKKLNNFCRSVEDGHLSIK